MKAKDLRYNRSCVEIDMDSLRNNIREIRKVTSPSASVMAVVKADAYGHGAVRVAKAVLENGADQLCVATIDEAIELRKSGIDAKILILGYTCEHRFADVVKYDVDQSVYTMEDAEILSSEALKQNKEVCIHIKLDTGMGRLGFPCTDESVETITAISKLPGIKMYGIFSHFAVADEGDDSDAYTLSQFDKFMAMTEKLKANNVTFVKRHICNSAGIMRFPSMHLDMVRAGIILYGLIPPGCPEGKFQPQLKPVMSWYARVINDKIIDEGVSVSYGRHYKATKPSRILTISVGYADGLSRHFSNGALDLIIENKRMPIVGNVCMDMCMVESDDLKHEAYRNEEVLVFGKERSADELAKVLGTINYEITCDVGKRVPRIYTDDNK